MKVLVAGWFSFERMGATVGDLLCRDIVSGWLDREKIPYDVALAPPFAGGVRWEETEPRNYTHIIFACGPFGNGPPITEFLEYFKGCRLIGVNLSMLQALAEWNPFDLLLERDSTRAANPDLTFLSKTRKVPVVGLVLVEPQREYGGKARHQEANEAIRRLLAGRPCAIVPIDTRLDVPNRGGLRSPEEIESLLARMDLVVSTRLHGLVLALKHGVPVLAVDAILGGAKVARQARIIGWPCSYLIDGLDQDALSRGYEYCLTQPARDEAVACRNRARKMLAALEPTLIRHLVG